jgi:dipeptidyl aminopeptidase/acylaminoacyl peptidase
MQAMFTAEAMVAMPRVTAVVPSPCGTWLAVAVQRLCQERAKYQSDLWKVPLHPDGSTGAPVQLTRGETRDCAPCFRHDGALGFLSNRTPTDTKPDKDADKRMQVWVLPAEGGEPVQLTDEPLGVEAFKFAAQAPRLVLTAPVLADVAHDQQRAQATDRAQNGPSARRYTRQPVRHWDHWNPCASTGAHTHLIAYNFEGGQARTRIDLTPDARSELMVEPEFDVADDGSHAVVTWTTPGTDRISDVALWLAPLGDAPESGRILCQQSLTEHASPKFSPDGKIIAVVFNERKPGLAPLLRIALVDVASGERSVVAPAWDAWPHLHGWSPDGNSIIAGADVRGRTSVFGIGATDGAVMMLASGGSLSGVSAFNAGGASERVMLTGIVSRLTHAPEPFACPWSQAEAITVQPATRFTGSTALPEVTLEEFETISTDGVPIHSYFIKPREARGPLPLVMFIHGGPISCFGDIWHWRWNPLAMVQEGYAVVLPNARGSTGYGQDFIQGIWGNQWGAQCYRDLMAVADASCARDDIDAQRTLAMGGSFGGYMTNWIGTQTDRFKGLITHASVYWMSGFTGVTDMPPFWHYEMSGTPYANPDVFDRYSPSKYVGRWKSPALIIHGEKDYRCPVSESLMLFEALQEHGVESDLLIFPDENHWILKPRNIIAWYGEVLAFIGRHLGSNTSDKDSS